MDRHISVLSLVEGLMLQKIGRWPRGGGGSLAVPVNIGHIVGARPDGGFPDVQLG